MSAAGIECSALFPAEADAASSVEAQAVRKKVIPRNARSFIKFIILILVVV
jgi:hypothetical protein